MTDLHEQIFRNSNEAMLLIDPIEDRLLDANTAAEQLLRFPPERLHKTTASEYFLPSFTQLINFTQCVLHNGAGWCNDIKIQAGDGELLELEISAASFEHAGQPLLALRLLDPAEQNALREVAKANSLHRRGLAEWKTIESIFQEFEHENQLILNAAGEGIYGVDTNGNATFFNPAAEQMLGWDAEDLIGKNAHNCFHHHHLDGTRHHIHNCHIFAAFQDGEVRSIDDEVFWRKDGKPIAVEYTSTPIKDQGRLVGAVVIFRDITARKQSEEQLRSAMNEVQALKQRLELENAYLQEEYRVGHNYKEIIGNSTAIRNVIQQIELVAPTDANVLVTGESGTGKELIAQAIHDSSNRSDRPLIRVNCASIPRDLFESEFFGHVKGAFTGAVSERVGRFELADGGTLFLDEVGEIPLELQSKLLRVLQDQRFERVGGTNTINVDVRIIAATNRNLKQEVQAGNFREDLYFRLNVFPIELAPLRERADDIPLLASHFLSTLCEKQGRQQLQFSYGNIESMQSYPWPGNIREMVNFIERTLILTHGNRLQVNLPDIETDVPPNREIQVQPKRESDEIITEANLRQLERNNLIAALRHCGGRVFGSDGAAELIGIKPTTLTSRLKKLSINRHDYV